MADERVVKRRIYRITERRKTYKPVNLSPEKHKRAKSLAVYLTAQQPNVVRDVSIPEAFMFLIDFYETQMGIKLK